MITKKNVNKLQNAVIKENASNLVGAVKLYNALFANGADLKAVCKALEIPAEYAVKVAALAKYKKRLVAVCSQMLPKVDDTFVKFALYSKGISNDLQTAFRSAPFANNALYNFTAPTKLEAFSLITAFCSLFTFFFVIIIPIYFNC